MSARETSAPRQPPRSAFSSEEARRVGERIGIDWASAPFDIEQFRAGMNVELEHGLQTPTTNVSDDDPVVTGRIALAHLNEFPDYYTRLGRMEAEAKRDHARDPIREETRARGAGSDG
ncbi:MAG: DUF5661 family protein [Gaiellaceae bacterium]